MILATRNGTLDFASGAIVMGIVNLSPDSFSGDGHDSVEAAVAHAREHLRDGARIIDLGAESARTNRGPISEQEEIDRLCAFIEQWDRVIDGFRTASGATPLLSLNTWRPGVARAVLQCGGDILNDISGLPDSENARICAEHGAALVIMHSVGEPKVAHTHVSYPDVLRTVDEFFEEKLTAALSAGLRRESIILDPGIDFAKQRADNLTIYRGFKRFAHHGCPILLPVSRKTVIGEVLGLSKPEERDAGTVACIVAGLLRGAQIFRVHHVKAAVQTIRTIEAITHGAE